ncbi:LysE/ArgO family amino acid transporter [Kushneria marisflavi]|uniref:Amino acid transporter n=1 Tax=Kushneria marisflavi TaxID=157779 RepID=A0A240ULR3_9GAMM|nr:LysE/ArgO family amino acid transporter [Kushneria marisflavi]ART62055.1 amino acid transporter [Kushneria marisflavi]RKD87121.1 L-lysine exporter family protein LysE/ArgO [Kushneria marisflavi]
MASFWTGLGLGLSLIMAIGAQNAFVLRQGLRGEHLLMVCLCCALSDALLLAFGVYGAATLIEQFPALDAVLRLAGALFLLMYGARGMAGAVCGGQALVPVEQQRALWPRTLAVCLALTWLNPHVYLDTVVLAGAVSAQQPSKGAFLAGAITASFIFFFGLGHGAGRLRAVLSRPRAWQILDGSMAMVMWGVALSLLWPMVRP